MGFWRSLIPRHVNNRLVLHVYDAWSFLTFFTGGELAKIEEENITVLSGEESPWHAGVASRQHTGEAGMQQTGAEHPQHAGVGYRQCVDAGKPPYIENQKEWSSVKFGKTDMAFAGCEIMAVANALMALGNPMSAYEMAGLITYFTAKGAVRGGRFGTSPLALRTCINENGYPVITERVCTQEHLHELQEKAQVYIAVVYNDRDDIMAQIHTVCITRDGEGFTTHNRTGVPGADGQSTERTESSLYEAVHSIRPKAKPICVFGIVDTCRYSTSS